MCPDVTYRLVLCTAQPGEGLFEAGEAEAEHLGLRQLGAGGRSEDTAGRSPHRLALCDR